MCVCERVIIVIFYNFIFCICYKLWDEYLLVYVLRIKLNEENIEERLLWGVMIWGWGWGWGWIFMCCWFKLNRELFLYGVVVLLEILRKFMRIWSLKVNVKSMGIFLFFYFVGNRLKDLKVVKISLF